MAKMKRTPWQKFSWDMDLFFKRYKSDLKTAWLTHLESPDESGFENACYDAWCEFESLMADAKTALKNGDVTWRHESTK